MFHGTSIRTAATAFLFTVMFLPTSYAAPLLYHFEGNISTVEYDDASLIAEQGLGVGSPVQYDFILDFDRPAEITHNDGTVEIRNDFVSPDGSISTHYFFADFVGGQYLQDPIASKVIIPNGALKDTYGSYSKDSYLSMGSLSVWGSYYLLSLSNYNPVESWGLGDKINVLSTANNLDLQPSVFRATMTLSAISPIPEPTTYLLFSSGLLIILARKMNKQSGTDHE